MASIRFSCHDIGGGIDHLELRFDDVPDPTPEQRSVILECFAHLAKHLGPAIAEACRPAEPVARGPGRPAVPLTIDQDAELVEALAAGTTYKEAAVRFGISPSTVPDVRARHLAGARLDRSGVLARCWCACEEIPVDVERVRTGRKPSCGARGCTAEGARAPRIRASDAG